MFWAPFELEFGINHLRLEWRIFLEQDTVSPMFGLCERKGENLRFHVSIIADSLFIVNYGLMPILIKMAMNCTIVNGR
jgi:hypothetical protein